MKHILLYILLIFSCNTFAHEYHIALSEVEYKNSTNTIQASITVSTHDFEHTLEDNNSAIQHLEKHTENKLIHIKLADFILQHFKISTSKEECDFQLIGYEVLRNGNTIFYFESQKIAPDDQFEVLFDLMMNENPKQQNKLTFILGKEKQALPFLENNRKQTFIFKQDD